MTNQIILANSEEKGVTLVSNGEYINALVNGKLYRTFDYRPLNGNGRQLREESVKTIKELLPAAKATLERIKAAEAEELAAKVAAAQNAAAPAPRSFAEVLEESFVKTLTEKTSGELVEQMYPTLEKMVIEKFGMLPQTHVIKVPERPAVTLNGVLHKDFDIIVSMVNDNEPVYLCGPAGTGKSYLAQQVAQALNLEYWYTASVVDDIQLKGFIDANGRYHETQFYKAFTSGGVFLLDELDASVPETLVLLNNALANGYFDFPTGRATAHPDFHPIAAGNTFGTGADAQYTGRYCLDAASMNRFSLIMVDYDRRIETAMAQGDESLVAFANDFRKAVAKCGTACLCTYRDIKRLAKFVAYMDKADAIRIGLTKGLQADDIRAIYERMTCTNDWRDALRKLF